jgi:hypothetical protein
MIAMKKNEGKRRKRNEFLIVCTLMLPTIQPPREVRKKKTKQVGINHTREGMGGARQPAVQVEGEQ